jgi:type IV pilus assembly protein PilX
MKNLKSVPGTGKHSSQKGAILVFCLVFLAILTVMGTSGMETTILEERMSSNMRDYNLAFQSAESALKNAEAWLVAQTSLPVTSSDGSTRVWTENAMDPAAADGKFWWDHANINPAWWAANADAIAGVGEVASQPTYVIEQYRTVDSGQSIAIGSGQSTVPRIFHRITARGVGVNATTAVRLQSTFVRSYNN